LVDKPCSLLTFAKIEVSILSGKGIGEIRGITGLRCINRQKRAL
jgi:hypothetical protein